MRFPFSLASLLILNVIASAGDRDMEFQDCIDVCPSIEPQGWLRLMQWTALDDCKYWCMHKITRYRIEQGLSIQQYYGKWPFIRVFGLQVIFINQGTYISYCLNVKSSSTLLRIHINSSTFSTMVITSNYIIQCCYIVDLFSDFSR